MAEVKSSKLASRSNLDDLPPEILLQILSRLDQNDLKPITLSKSFLAPSSSRVHKLVFRNSVRPSTVHRRFPSLKSLRLALFVKDEAMQFVQLFPLLTELDFGTSFIEDAGGFEQLMSEVPNLRKIEFRGPVRLYDNCIRDVLAANCVPLEHAGLESCFLTSPRGVCKFANLSSLDLPNFNCRGSRASLMELDKTMSSSVQNFSNLSIYGCLVFDDALQVIAKSFPTWSLPGSYSMKGLIELFCARQGLPKLEICTPLVKCYYKMIRLMQYLPCLRHIQITSMCRGHATLFSLIENCLSL